MPIQKPIIVTEIRRSKIVRIILANQTIIWLEASRSGSWNTRDVSLAILWLEMERLITSVIITIMEDFGFVTNLINSM